MLGVAAGVCASTTGADGIAAAIAKAAIKRRLRTIRLHLPVETLHGVNMIQASTEGKQTASLLNYSCFSPPLGGEEHEEERYVR